MPIRKRTSGLHGRERETAVLDELAAALRAGDSRVLVLRGEAGIGKTALVEQLLARTADLLVLRAVGVESEMELTFAGLHQLCVPLLAGIERLPEPQRAALEVVFGLRPGAAPTQFMVGLAVLGLLSDAAEARAVLCVVDDAQWLDRSSLRILAFVARRLLAEPVGIVFALREPDELLAGLPELALRGLDGDAARALLSVAAPFLHDGDVLTRIVAETRGNPLALLELPQALDPAQLPATGGAQTADAVATRIEETFLARVHALPEQERMLLLVAAAEPVGDPELILGAAARLGLDPDATGSLARDGLLTIEQRASFRHPLLRSAAYRAGSPQARRSVHLALADVTDRELDPDRRAWHLAAAAAGPDEAVAAELERSAGHARARGGLPAAAALLERAVMLSGDPARRVERALAAAEASLRAGAFQTASALLAELEGGPLSELQRAQASVIEAQLAFAQRLGSDIAGLLLGAARMLEPLDPVLARDTYLEAWRTALFAGYLAVGTDVRDVSRAARAAPPPAGPPRVSDRLLGALSALYTDGLAASVSLLERTAQAFAGDEATGDELLRWGWVATSTAIARWDYGRGHTIAARAVARARAAGALTVLPVSLNVLSQVEALAGDVETAADLLAESDAVSEAIGVPRSYNADVVVAAIRGRVEEAFPLIEEIRAQAQAARLGTTVNYCDWAQATLLNGQGRYRDALAPALAASGGEPPFIFATWARVEAIEAAARSGSSDLAATLLGEVTLETQACGGDWALGLEARSRALLAGDDVAEPLYRAAITHLAATAQRHELGRAHLVYGEWLRRGGRRFDARDQLRAAYETLADAGMEAFAERARLELRATGATARRRQPEARDELTAQERQIATLAAQRLSNPEIGERLFLSHRTVEWHLRKVFAKLGISSRRELAAALKRAGRGASG